MAQPSPQPLPDTVPSPAAEASAGQSSQYLTFTLNSEVFAIGILRIKEIIEYSSLTTVPLMPRCVRGVINLRGAVVPVIDLAVRFSREPYPVTRRTCIVIIEIATDREGHDVGIVVDSVLSVLDIRPSDIEPPPAFGSTVCSHFISGIGKTSGRFTILLDVDHVMDLEETAALKDAGAAAAASP